MKKQHAAKQPPRITCEAPVKEREHHYPVWYQKDLFGSDIQHSTASLKSLVEEASTGRFKLPKFQRPYVWTDEQVIKLFDSFIQGFHVGSLLVWEQYKIPASTEVFGGVTIESKEHRILLIVDGQQRLGSIISAALSGRFWFDLAKGCLTTEGPGPWRAPAEQFLVRGRTAKDLWWYQKHAAEFNLPEEDVLDAWVAMQDTLDRVYVSYIRMGYNWSLDRVMESYRRLNTEGTPMDPELLKAALEKALQ